MKSTKLHIFKNVVSEKFRKQFYFFTCILPDYVSHESLNEFWKNSHFENMRAGFLKGVKTLVTQPMLQRRPNPTELRSMDYYHQIFCRFRKCKRKDPPPSPLSNDFEKSWGFSLFFKVFARLSAFFKI